LSDGWHFLTARPRRATDNSAMPSPWAAVALVFLQLPSSARIHGHVVDPSGAVIVGATVIATDGAGHVRQVKADRQGAYAIDPIDAGTWTVVASATGFADGAQTVDIGAGQDRLLDFHLVIDTQRQAVVVEGAATRISTDPNANANALVLRGADLDALSDDPNELEAQLKMLGGAAAGPSGGQIFVDGFTGGRLPPKSSILEVRVNQNPYSAEYDVPGQARVEVITKPGGRSFHGRFVGDLNAAWMNSRNPFLADPPAYHSGSVSGSLDGPLGGNASFTFGVDRIAIDDAAAVAAIGLDDGFNPVAIHQAVPTRHDTLQLSPRVDAQLAHRHTLSVRYLFYGISDAGSGVGQFALPSQALDVHRTEHDLQVSEQFVMSTRTLNELRLEVRQNSIDQAPADTSAAVYVQGAFMGGGSAAGSADSTVRHVELQDAVTASRSRHLLKVGGRIRADAASDVNGQNANGTFTFASLDAYQVTERGLSQGWTPAQIRASGGGASQFSVVFGDPTVRQTTADGALFVEDDWRVANRVTVGSGLRYEMQTGVAGFGDLAPRVSVAWALGPAAKNGSTATVIRAGAGLFYDRVPQSLFLQSLRLDGTGTRQFIVSAPDFYPLVPPASAFVASQHPTTPYRIDPAIAAPRTIQEGVTLEQRLAPGATAAIGYLHSSGSRQLYSQVVDGAYQFTSGGRFTDDQLTVNLTVRNGGRVSVGAAYVLSYARGDTSGPNAFPSDPGQLEADYGRMPFDVRHRLTLFMGLDGPGFRIVPTVFASSGSPFDITVGQDLNGDTIFNDRPAFATDPSRPSVIATPFGVFDTQPIPGQRVIPRNYGSGPAQVQINLRAMKPFVVHQHDTIRVDLLAINLMNRANLALPVGSLASPVFGQSTSLAAGGASSSNRQFRVQLQFIF
jgi:hypothetical protein